MRLVVSSAAVLLLMLVLSIAASVPSSAASPGCSILRADGGSCSSKETRPGSPGRSDSGASNPGRDSSSSGSERSRSAGGGGGSGGSGSPTCVPVNVPSEATVSEVCGWLNRPGAPGGGGGRAAPPTPVVTEEDFQNFEIPPSTLHSWPDSWAVTQRRTAFWAVSSVRYIDLELLGTPVRVRATPVAYSWDFGDGTARRTTSPGKRPRSAQEAQIHHTYSSAEDVTVTLTTFYSGMFSVNGGDWLIIPGQAAVESPPLSLTVYRYHKFLVDDDCLDNPDSPDCGPPSG
jgi:hypothetical protein